MPENKRVLILGASGLIGTPIVCTLQQLPGFTPIQASSRKIPGYLHVPFDSLENPDDWRRLLLDNSIIGEKEILLRNKMRVMTPYYEIKGHTVWGATAMILSEFRTILLEIEPASL